MKKQLLSLLALSISGFLLAQSGEEPKEGTRITAEILNELNTQSRARLAKTHQDREEIIQGWVSFELTQYDEVHGESNFFTYGQVVSPDSLQKVSFSGGVFRSYIHGFGQVFDPTAADLEFTDARLTVADGYRIDSIGVPCLYRRMNHNGIDDTLIMTVAITDKTTSGANPYDGSFFWTPTGILNDTTSVMAPSYIGTPADGYHSGLLGVTDAAANVEIQEYKFALTEADTDINWKSFPVDVDAGPDQIIYTFVEFKPSYETSALDTAFAFDGADGNANVNSFRTLYDFPVTEDVGYFFDLYRDDQFSYNASYVSEVNARYGLYADDNAWRNDRLGVYSLWGFRFEYYMDAVASIGIEEEERSDFNIYPNPTNGQVTFSMMDEQTVTGNVSVQDLSGKVIFETAINTTNNLVLNTRDLGLSKGIYLVVITTDNKQYSQKLIVK